MRGSLFRSVPLATLFACAGHSVRPAEGGAGGATPAAAPPVAAPGPTSPEPTVKPQPPEPYQGYADSATINVRRIGQWNHTGIVEPRRQVIQDANAWAQFWSALSMGDRPEVDFEQELVIAVASGQQRTGGYAIAVDRVSRQAGELTIHVTETSPGPNCMTTSELTQPVEAVAIPRTKVERWNFEERKAVSDCR
ncbi:MAG TPA: protease complex subunit PrcB family protein [Gemmatimonadales bacterium]|jgi:hypothetical protein